nr:hypothetical protein [Tanacetum cinerariifolium]
VLDLEKTKTTQALEITSLKRRVKKLEKKKRSRTCKLKRLYKVGLTAKVDSFKDELRFSEDASKQERKINDIDADEDITLVNDQDDAKMFDVNDLHGEEVFVENEIADKELIVVTTQDKVKCIMVEERVKLKRKDQIRLNEETALKLQAKFDEEEQRLARVRAKKELEANIALIDILDDVQAKIDVDYQLAKRLQAKEQQELTNEEKATLFMQLLQKRREAFKRVNTFVDFRTVLVEGSLKRAGEELIQESTKKQNVEDDKETVELKQLMEIILDEEEVAIDAIPLAVKSQRIDD